MTPAEELVEAEEMREAWRKAYLALATASEYTIGSRTITRYAEARDEFFRWDRVVRDLAAGRAPGVRAVRVIPRDL